MLVRGLQVHVHVHVPSRLIYPIFLQRQINGSSRRPLVRGELS